ncbi:unnamed protein product [Lactuca saligna]|uniref:Uncharacterized protein n=1 Tax=Lactuca saligna TaxID=75948 RepID=A0AA35YAX6_LACSI|nr:unnamed protein product [Lactuca saligna]
METKLTPKLVGWPTCSTKGGLLMIPHALRVVSLLGLHHVHHFVGDSEDQGDRLADRQQSLEELVRASGTTTRSIERRVERLEEENKDDYEAILTLYHRMSDSRTEVNAMSAHIRSLEYQIHVM